MMYTFYPALQRDWIGLLYNLVIFGGKGSMGGALISAITIGVIQSVTQLYLPPTWALVIIERLPLAGAS